MNNQTDQAQRPRRFLAGAKCPKCGARDTIYFTDDTNDIVNCADCDYEARRPEDQTPSEELKTGIKEVAIKILETPHSSPKKNKH